MKGIREGPRKRSTHWLLSQSAEFWSGFKERNKEMEMTVVSCFVNENRVMPCYNSLLSVYRLGYVANWTLQSQTQELNGLRLVTSERRRNENSIVLKYFILLYKYSLILKP